VPALLEVPGGNVLELTLYATGYQIYNPTTGLLFGPAAALYTDVARTTFYGFHYNGNIAQHLAAISTFADLVWPATTFPPFSCDVSGVPASQAPTWQDALQCSSVAASPNFNMINHAVPATDITDPAYTPGHAKADTIAWLLLRATGHPGPAGPLSDITFLQRIETDGGGFSLNGTPEALSHVLGSTAYTFIPYDTTYTFFVAPEPSTLALLATGFAALLGYGWRRRAS
jgi:hypothetical protein